MLPSAAVLIVLGDGEMRIQCRSGPTRGRPRLAASRPSLMISRLSSCTREIMATYKIITPAFRLYTSERGITRKT